MKSLRAELYQLLAHYIPEATLQQNVQDRDFPTRRVRRSHFRLTWMSLKWKCSELRRLATAQELSNPVSFALENSWTITVNLTSNTFLSTLHSIWRRFLSFLLSPWRLFSPSLFRLTFGHLSSRLSAWPSVLWVYSVFIFRLSPGCVLGPVFNRPPLLIGLLCLCLVHRLWSCSVACVSWPLEGVVCVSLYCSVRFSCVVWSCFGWLISSWQRPPSFCQPRLVPWGFLVQSVSAGPSLRVSGCILRWPGCHAWWYGVLWRLGSCLHFSSKASALCGALPSTPCCGCCPCFFPRH